MLQARKLIKIAKSTYVLLSDTSNVRCTKPPVFFYRILKFGGLFDVLEKTLTTFFKKPTAA